MELRETIGLIFIISGLPFFLSGSLGLLRFPDVYTRLHALTKADNVGLGLIVLGLICQAESLGSALSLIMVWLLVLVASSASCHLIARRALHKKIRPWMRP